MRRRRAAARPGRRRDLLQLPARPRPPAGVEARRGGLRPDDDDALLVTSSTAGRLRRAGGAGTRSPRRSPRAGARQLHVAETEKYAHVTYFFNGGVEDEWPGETRILVPSPRDVPSYDHKPEMSAREVAARFAAEIGNGYRFAVINFANPDMVGHTGSIPAVTTAVEVADECLGVVVGRDPRRRRRLPGHGRPRQRGDDARAGWCQPVHGPHDESGSPRPHVPRSCAQGGGELSDLAPTALRLLGLDIPSEMSGGDLCAAAKSGPSV